MRGASAAMGLSFDLVGRGGGAAACDHYHRWQEDLDLCAAFGADTYRFSVNWARVLPDGRGARNPDGLDFYDRLVDGCLARGLIPNLTLYHWELPSALADVGGWTNPEIADWFADYTAILLGRLGDRVPFVSTFNEPWCVTWAGHWGGTHAPGMRDIRATARSVHNVLRAHARGMEVLRSNAGVHAGIVLNLDDVLPASESEEDHIASEVYDACFNRCFLDPLFLGRYPKRLLDGFAPHLPTGWEADMDRIAAPLDWLGINYYTRKLVTSGGGRFPDYSFLEGPLPQTTMGWEVWPEGLTRVLTRVAQAYTADLPLYVTENGMSADEPERAGLVEDSYRTDFLDRHFQAALAAIGAGVPLKGYFIWSLLDNFEWARGYGRRFGIVHTDFLTQERTPKASYHALAAALLKQD